MSEKVAILVTGTEVLDGRVAETNSHYLIREFAQFGIGISHVLSCGDSIEEIRSCLNFLGHDSAAVIVSGGLGPTTDDLTREAIAEYADSKLVFQGDVLARLEDYFRKKQRPFDPSNCKQALFPEGAFTIDNPVGSALGFGLRPPAKNGNVKLIVALPGVPRELRAMMEETVMPLFKRELGAVKASDKRVLRVFNVPESAIGSRVQAIEPASDVEVSYRAHFPEVEVVFKGHHRGHLTSTVKRAKESIGKDFIFSEDSELSMAGVVHALLIKKKWTIATAESCTAGLVSAFLTDTPGSSKYFVGGILSYSNEIKSGELAVRKTTLSEHGAVSSETACEMAKGIRGKYCTDVGISVTGIAGPDGGSEAKPVGTFYVGIALKKDVSAYKFFMNSTRPMIRTYAAWMALDVLRRKILKLPIHEHSK